MGNSAELKPGKYVNYLIMGNGILLLIDLAAMIFLLSKWSDALTPIFSQLDKLSHVTVLVIRGSYGYTTIDIGGLLFLAFIGCIAATAILLWKGFKELIDYGSGFRTGCGGAGLLLISSTVITVFTYTLAVFFLLAPSTPLLGGFINVLTGSFGSSTDIFVLFVLMYPIVLLTIFIVKSIALRMRERNLDSYIDFVNSLINVILLFLIILAITLTLIHNPSPHNLFKGSIVLALYVIFVLPIMMRALSATPKTLKKRLLESAGIAAIFSIIPLFVFFLSLWLALASFIGFALMGLAYSRLSDNYQSIPLRIGGVLLIIDGISGLIITIIGLILGILNLTQTLQIDSLIESFEAVIPKTLIEYTPILMVSILALQQVSIMIGLHSIKRKMIETTGSENN